ncbi:MAG: arginase family protein [Chloroflexota bacterium]|nr:MAG: arginase family protein [Chloroflexota bacterium]
MVRHGHSDQGDRSTLRLLMPQWQGGGDRPAYHLGGRLLAWLAPPTTGTVEEVSIDLQREGLAVERGIFAREAVLAQARAAKGILARRRPDRVVVLGGECSVDFAPFAYLNERYDGDLAVLWIDAHSDVSTPESNDPNDNFHGMVLSALMGIGDPEFVAEVPKPIDPGRVLYVGLRSFMEPLDELRELFDISIPVVSAEQVEQNSDEVLEWLRAVNAVHVAVHFDLDVLEPTEFNSAVWHDPNGLKVEAAVRLLADISRQVDVVGLGITEYTPHDAVLLSDMLQRLPILSDT